MEDFSIKNEKNEIIHSNGKKKKKLWFYLISLLRFSW